jgi:hypothetical protein
MDLTAGQRKAVFTLIVVVLTGLGVYMFVPAARGGSPPSVPRSPAPRHGATSAPAPAATPSPGASSAGSATPSAPDIYQWLPFTQSQLGTAAAVVTRFCDAYGTWSYTENAAAYVATMRTVITTELSQVLAQGYAAPGVAAQRAGKKQVSAGSAIINALSAFGPSSITFDVTIGEQITGTSGRSTLTQQYAVTVVAAGAGWQVNDIELATAGNS